MSNAHTFITRYFKTKWANEFAYMRFSRHSKPTHVVPPTDHNSQYIISDGSMAGAYIK